MSEFHDRMSRIEASDEFVWQPNDDYGLWYSRGFVHARDKAAAIAAEADRRLNYLAQMIGTEIRAITGDTYADTPAEPGDAMGDLREKIKGLQAKLAEAEREKSDLLRQWNELDLRSEKKHREWNEQLLAEKLRADAAEAKRAAVREAAQAVIDRWETPNWKEAEPTADVIARLRNAIGGNP